MIIEDSVIQMMVKPLIDQLNVTVSPYFQAQGPFAPIAVQVGPDAKKAMAVGSPPMLVWLPKFDDGYHVADDQPEDGSANYMTWTVCELTVWGKTLSEAERLRTAIINIGAEVYGGAIAKPYAGKGTYSGGDTSKDFGVKITFLYGFKVLLVANVWQPTTITEVNILQPPAPAAPEPSAGLIIIDGQNPDGTPTNPAPLPS